MNEAETRAEKIDPALQAAGWGVVEGSRIRREHSITLGRIEGHGRRGQAAYGRLRPGLSQYQAGRDRSQGVGQAKNYAGMLGVRFAYAANDKGIYGIDMQTGKEGELPRYPHAF